MQPTADEIAEEEPKAGTRGSLHRRAWLRVALLGGLFAAICAAVRFLTPVQPFAVFPANNKFVVLAKNGFGVRCPVEFSPEGSLFVVFDNSFDLSGCEPPVPITIRDVATGQGRFTVRVPSPYVGFEFSPDGSLFVTQTGDDQIDVFNSRTGECVGIIRPLPSLSLSPGFQFSADGKCIVIEDCDPNRNDHATWLWDTSSQQINGPVAHKPPLAIVNIPISQAWYFHTDDDASYGLPSDYMQLARELTAGHLSLRQMLTCFSPDGNLFAVKGPYKPGKSLLENWLPNGWNPFPARPQDSAVLVWDVASKKLVMTFEDCVNAVFSPNGAAVATIEKNGAVKLWHVPFRKPLLQVLTVTAEIWLWIVLFMWLISRWQRRAMNSRAIPSVVGRG